MTKRYFPRSKQFIFILGIIVISVITGFFGSFFTSITQRDYFVSSTDDNVINIFQSGFNSPVTSFVPSNYLDVLKHIDGITSISPEVHSLVLLDNAPFTLHGITKSFFELNSSIETMGRGLSYIMDSNRPNIIIAGYDVAKSLDLKVGQDYVIYSYTTSSFLTFHLAGIVKFNSFYDEELFTNIGAARYFRYYSSTDYFSMIRIKIDPTVVSKSEVSDYLSHLFTLDLHYVSHYQDPALIQNKKVKVFFSNGDLVDEKTTDENGFCSFNLPIGIYQVYFDSGTTIYNQTFLFLNSTTKYLYVDNYGSPTNLANNYNLSISSFYNNTLTNNTNLALTFPTGSTFYFKGNGTFLFNNISSGTYNINLQYNNLTLAQSIEVQSNENVSLSFTKTIFVNLKNTADNDISDFSCSFYNYRTNVTLNYNSCPNQLNLEHSTYNMSLTTVTNLNTWSIIKVTDQSSNFIQSYVGTTIQSFQIQSSSGSALSGITLYYSTGSETNFNLVGSTDSNGLITFPYTFGKHYYLLFSNGAVNASIDFQPTSLHSLIVYRPFHSFDFQSFFLDGTNSNSPITFQSITVSPLGATSFNLLTDSSGKLLFTPSADFIGHLTISSIFGTKSFWVDTHQTTSYNFTLGSIDISFFIRSTGLETIPNVHIQIDNVDYSSESVNSNGVFHVQVPSSSSYNFVHEQFIFPNNNNLYSYQSSFLFQHTYHVKVYFNNTQYNYYFPKTYQYSNYNISLNIPYFFNVNFKIKDASGRYIDNVQVILENNNYNYNSVSRNNGNSALHYVNPGQYDVTLKYLDFTMNLKLTVKSDLTINVQLPIYVNKININYFQPNISALNGKQYLDQFYNTSIAYFLQIFTILIVTVTFILIMLFSSVVKLTVESIEYEVFVLNLLGTSKWEMFTNLVYNFQLRSFVSSVIGLVIGMFLSGFLNTFNHIQILGFIFYSQFNIGYFLFFLTAINVLIAFVLINILRKMDLIYPIHLIRRH